MFVWIVTLIIAGKLFFYLSVFVFFGFLCFFCLCMQCFILFLICYVSHKDREVDIFQNK